MNHIRNCNQSMDKNFVIIIFLFTNHLYIEDVLGTCVLVLQLI